MRALILVAGAALAVSACSSNDAANNTMNVDENLTDMNATTDMNAPADMNAVDMNATNAADTANAAADTANAAANTANTAANNAM
jgi:uncharacterized lipoprotein